MHIEYPLPLVHLIVSWASLSSPCLFSISVCMERNRSSYSACIFSAYNTNQIEIKNNKKKVQKDIKGILQVQKGLIHMDKKKYFQFSTDYQKFL